MQCRPAFPLVILGLVFAGFWALEQPQANVIFGIVAGLFFAAALVGVYYLCLGLAMASVLVRAIFALIPVTLLTGSVVAVVLRFELDTQITRALIAAVVIAAGWVVGYMTAEWRRVSADQERRRDIVRAAITELELIADHGGRADWDKAMAEVRKNFSMQARYEVFIFYGHQFGTLRRLVEQIEILRWEQIRPVMDVYQALDRLERMEHQIRSEAFHKLPKTRRQEGLLRYLKLNSQIPAVANAAVAALRNGPFQGWLKWLA